LKLLNDTSSTQMLQGILEKCNSGEEIQLEQKKVNHVHSKKRTNREFRMNEIIGDFNMGDIILHLVIQVDIDGHPPFLTGSKQFLNFGNLLFLAGFNFRDHFEGLNECFSRSRLSIIAKGIFEPPK
jgi:hypothetical protein